MADDNQNSLGNGNIRGATVMIALLSAYLFLIAVYFFIFYGGKK